LITSSARSEGLLVRGPGKLTHGLGLAIVSAIVGVHGAELTVTARPEGSLGITVSFP
jgi:K+-sensing histidine kinase KdpD